MIYRVFNYCFSILLTIIIILLSGAATGTCHAATGSPDIRVGSELEFPPYAFVDEKGQAAGFSVDLIKAVSNAMGLSITITTGTWDSEWNDLISGRLDMLPIVAKLPDRIPLVDFSLPHTETYDAFFVRKGSDPVRSISQALGKEIVVMRSDAAHHALLEYDFQGPLILVDTIPQGLSLIASGNHDAFLCSKLIGTLAISQHGIKGLTSGPPVPNYKRVFSFAVKKGDSELLEKLNQGLLIIKASGEYQRIYDKWLTMEDPWQRYMKYLKPAIFIMLVVVLIGSFWLKMLQRQVRKRTLELTEKNELLQQVRDGLDKTVAERTSALSTVNAALLSEIAERKRAEKELLESEKKFKMLVENSPMAISFINKEGVIEYINPQHINMAGYTLEDIPTLEHWWSLAYRDEEVRKRTISEWQSLMHSFFSLERNPLKIERRIFCKDGTIKDVELFITPVSDKILVVFHDITERKKVEDAIKKEHDFNQLIIASAGEGICVCHEVGEFPYVWFTIWNDYMTAITGYSMEEINSLGWYQSMYPDPVVQEQAIERMRRMRIGDDLQGEEWEITRADGQKRLILITTSIISSDEGTPHVLAVMNDITEHKRAEEEKEKLQAQLQQAQKMEAIGHLAGGVAHDFNNILTAIIGYAHIALMKMKDDDPLRIHLEHILSSSEKAATLTKSLLAFSRKQPMQMKDVNINDIVSGMSKILSRIISEDIYLQVHTAVHDLIVNADKNQLEQVLMNLATNARDAMPDGGTLTVSTESFNVDETYIQMHQEGELGQYAVLSVTDTGMGIDEKTRENIFDPFFTTKEVGKGTGLGLAMIYGTIKQHNGFINVYSKLGKGTTFKIYLPLSESGVKVTEKKEAVAIPSGTETILLAEDDEAVRSATKALLQEFGYSVIEAIDGKQAIKLFMENKDTIQLVITDIIMPGQSGKDLHNDLLKITTDVKILFLSGYPADILARKGIIDNDVHFILKPANPETLLKKMREILDE